MKKLTPTLIVLGLGLMFPLRSFADMPTPMTMEEVCKYADNIVIAEVVSHQFESLKNGKSVKVMDDGFWVEYRITKILKGGGVKLGKVIRLDNIYHGYCETVYATATRKGKDIIVKRDKNYAGETIKLTNLRKKHGQKVILFLKNYKNKKSVTFSHTGKSPSAYSEKSEKQISSYIKK